MSDSGESSSADPFDHHLSSLTAGQFRQSVEINGLTLVMLDVMVRKQFIEVPVTIWDGSTGPQMNNHLSLEGFIISQVRVENHNLRGKHRRSVSPVRKNGAFTIVAKLAGQALETVYIEYKPAPGFVYTR